MNTGVGVTQGLHILNMSWDCLKGISVLSESGAHPEIFVVWAGADPEASAIYVWF